MRHVFLPMIISLLIGIAVGFVLAIPPGPVGVSVIRIALNNDREVAYSSVLERL
jgi:threonine/homoserine/homoserine lactone efflux protein